MPPSESELAAERCLRAAGFASTRFIGAPPGSRSADLVAERGGERWAVEVRGCSRPLRADATFEPAAGRALPYPTLESYFALAWAEKRGQIEATCAAERCGRGMLLILAHGCPDAAWTRALERAWAAAGAPRAVAFAVASSGRIEAMFPS